MDLPTHDELHSLFHYDPESGVLTWKTRLSPRAGIGDQAGCVRPNGYRGVGINGLTIPSHRIIWCMQTGSWPEHDIDHRNNLRDDNRWENLRLAIGAGNYCNKIRHRNNTSGVKGVSWDTGTNKWRAQIQLNKRRVYDEVFPTLEEAKASIEAARLELHGEFSNHG